MIERGTSFGRKAIGSVIVVGAAQAIKTGLQFLSTLFFARFLEPSDFGLIAAVAPVLTFIILFQDIGIQQAVIQRKEISEDQLNRLFWIVSIIGFLCACVVVFIAPFVARFYSEPKLSMITIVASFALFLNSLAALPTSLINRNLRFSQLAIVGIFSSVSGFCVGIFSAWLGASYWALVVMPIVGAIVNLIGVFVVSGWRPGRPAFGIDRDIIGFGANLTGFNILNFFSRNLDNILIGRYHGGLALGYYDIAYKLLLFPIRSINEPIGRVIIPMLGKVQEDKERVRRIYLRTVGVMQFLVVPGIAVVTIAAEDVIVLLLGLKWLAIAPVFSWLGIASLGQVMGNSTGWIFISQGRTDVMFKWGIYSSLITSAAFVVGLPWGIEGVAIAYVLASYGLLSPVLYYLMGKTGPVKTSEYLKLQLPSLIAAGLTWLVAEYLLRGVWVMDGIPFILATGLVSYVLAALAFSSIALGRATLKDSWNLLSKVPNLVRRREL
ncbi:MAG: lipopolysaccharide biosynthesis protein [Nitrosomonas sp.]|nr:lipopolysaccharide biosynthesis protein [Nitrosomonas sp.]